LTFFIFFKEFGFSTIVLSNRIRGEAALIGSTFADVGVRIVSKVGPFEDQLRRLQVDESQIARIEQVRDKTDRKKANKTLEQQYCFKE